MEEEAAAAPPPAEDAAVAAAASSAPDAAASPADAPPAPEAAPAVAEAPAPEPAAAAAEPEPAEAAAPDVVNEEAPGAPDAAEATPPSTAPLPTVASGGRPALAPDQRLVELRQTLREMLVSEDAGGLVTFEAMNSLFSMLELGLSPLGVTPLLLGLRLRAALPPDAPDAGAPFDDVFDQLVAPITPYDVELCKLHEIFDADGPGGKGLRTRAEIQAGIAARGVDLAALGLSDDVVRAFFEEAMEDGEDVADEQPWALDEFLEAAQAATDALAEQQAADVEAAGSAADGGYERGDRVAEALLWSCTQVADWVETELGFPQYRICFEANNIHGGRLLAMSFDTLPRLSIRQYDHCSAIARGIRRLKGLPEEKLETLRDVKLNSGRFEPPAKLRDTLVRLRYGSAGEFSQERRNVHEAYARPVLQQPQRRASAACK